MHKAIIITITRFIDSHQPGFVECIFTDVNNNRHVINEKAPVVTPELLDENSTYPLVGTIACKIISTHTDASGRNVITIDISEPWDIETIDGRTRFEIFENQLTDID